MEENNNINEENEAEGYSKETIIHDVVPVSGMYENWFLDYASYVILERAVPAMGVSIRWLMLLVIPCNITRMVMLQLEMP